MNTSEQFQTSGEDSFPPDLDSGVVRDNSYKFQTSGEDSFPPDPVQ